MEVKLLILFCILHLKVCSVLSMNTSGDDIPPLIIINISLGCVLGDGQTESLTATISSGTDIILGDFIFEEYAKKTDKEVSIYFLHRTYGSLNEKINFNVAKDWFKASDKTKNGMICLAKTTIRSTDTGKLIDTGLFEGKNVEVTKLVTEKTAQFINRIAGKSVVRVAGMYTGATHAGEFLYHLQRIRGGQQADDLLAFEPPDILIPSSGAYIGLHSAQRVQVIRVFGSKRIESNGHLNIFIIFPSKEHYLPDIFIVTVTKTYTFYAVPAESIPLGAMLEYHGNKNILGFVPRNGYLIGMHHDDFIILSKPMELRLKVTNQMLNALKSYNNQ